jgi:hypothetical protein
MTIINLEPELLVNDAHGVYIPQIFCQQYGQYLPERLNEDKAICLSGPEHEDYFDAWDNIVDTEITNDKGQVMTIGYLPESCDLWAIPEGYEYDEN